MTLGLGKLVLDQQTGEFVYERNGLPLFTGVPGSTVTVDAVDLTISGPWLDNLRTAINFGANNSAWLTFEQRWPDNTTTTLPYGFSVSSAAWLAGGQFTNNGGISFTTAQGILTVGADAAVTFKPTSGAGGTEKEFSFAAGSVTGVDIDANGNAFFSLTVGGIVSSFLVSAAGSGSLSGGTGGGNGSVAVTQSEIYSSGNLDFILSTNYYTNGAIGTSGGTSGSSYSFNDFLNLDYTLKTAAWTGSITNPSFNSWNDWASDYLVNPVSGIGLPNTWGLLDWPIGAFYESRPPGNDPAPSIAADTPVLLTATGQGVSEAYLDELDSNHDGMLTGTELSTLRAWVDGDENGVAEAGEITTAAEAGLSEIREINYLYYAVGNAVAAPAAITAPTKSSEAVTISRVNWIQGVPASNYRTLRDTDNLYPLPNGQYIGWTASQVKINYNNKSYLIGTDGNDAFDATYYAANSSWFSLGLLVNFLGGNGDDTVGGSANSDNIWGGIGNDFLLGYAGHDYLYGEEGIDQLQGQEGNDYLDGGAAGDTLFGQVGNDILVGGDGDDILVGFTASNEAKQTLNAGETDNDYLYGGTGYDYIVAGLGDDYVDGGSEDDAVLGGAGNDIVFGGSGHDELQGNEGNDRLSGERGNDRMFGQVGNDILWGGEGDDVLVGFTASNEAKQTLSSGETDADTLYGGNGWDDLYGGFGDDTLDGGVGWDILLGQAGNDILFGGGDDDELQGGDGNDRLNGEAGNDNMFGQVGNDTLWGGAGDDVMIGFTASNEVKQTLSSGETDDDTLYGGAGNDLMLGALGKDVLQGEAGADQLQGGAGDDLLYGGDDDDRLFGQVGNDVLCGGAGDDILVGFTGYNETKQTLSFGETDNNWLYGGEGADILLGGVGDDYLDGGAGADTMEGGKGADIYVVNSVNDTILELAGEGYDMVVSSANYLLNTGVEELRLLEGYNIHGTGNALDNLIIGNSSDNILDGVTGADRMMGAAGNDTYYVDNAGDETIELAGEGTDTVQTTIDTVLADNVENMILLDFAKPEKGLVDGEPALVYGYPKANELDYIQGDAVPDFWGTCALTSIANLLTQADQPATESDVVERAIEHGWAVTDPTLPPYVRGGSNYMDQQALLDSYGIRNALIEGYNEEGTANLIRSGRGVIIAVNAGVLWGETGYVDSGAVNHVVTVTGVVYDEVDGELLGFYVADSGRHKVSDMTRFIDIASFRAAANVPYAYAIYTKEAIKLWDEDIDGTGNGLNNELIGNRGDNVLAGLAGNDMLNGEAGDDTLAGGAGIDTAAFSGNYADYVVSIGSGGVVTVRDTVSGRDGTDTMTGIEYMQFSDQTLPVPDDTPPVAHDDTGAADEDAPVTLTAASLLANDTDADAGDTKTLVSVSAASAKGASIALVDGNVVYDPRAAATLQALGAGQITTDMFTYAMRDAAGATSTAMVTMTITGTNDAPVAHADAGSAVEGGGPVTLSAASLLANDTDPDSVDSKALVSVSTTSVQGAAVSIQGGNVVYDPGDLFQGLGAGQTTTDTFTYVMQDAAGETSTATVTMAITGVNDAPVAADDVATNGEDAALTLTAADLLANDTDVDGGDTKALVSVSATSAKGAGVAIVDGNVVYDPTSATALQALGFGQTATDTFSYTMRDAAGTLSTATVTVMASGANDAPVAVADQVSTMQDANLIIDVLSNDSDVDAGDTRTATVASAAEHGTVVQNGDGTFTYKPDTGYVGSDHFTYELTDALGASSYATVSIAIRGRAIVGTDGDDVLRGGAGDDIIDGGAGNDTVEYSTCVEGVTANLAAGVAQGSEIGVDTLIGIENLVGGTGNDTLSGNAGRNLLVGGIGNDILNGGDGDDVLKGGAGDDTISGGAGFDMLDLSDAVGPISLNMSTGTASGAGIGVDVFTGIEAFVFGSGNDVVTGNTWTTYFDGGAGDDTLTSSNNNDVLIGGDGDDTLKSGSGDDVLKGGDGDDTIDGGSGADIIDGEAGIDVIVGGSGDDVISGGMGNDTLTGGSGHDTFMFARDFGADRITDFKTSGSGSDQIVFSADVFDSFASVLSCARQTDSGVEISAGSDNVLTLAGVQLAALSESSFRFDADVAENSVLGAQMFGADVAGAGAADAARLVSAMAVFDSTYAVAASGTVPDSIGATPTAEIAVLAVAQGGWSRAA